MQEANKDCWISVLKAFFSVTAACLISTEG